MTISQGRARELQVQPTLFGDDEREAEVYKYATHFRRQLKARLLKEKIVTQIVRETTLTPEEFRRENGMPMRRVEDPATIAWKLGTGAYYKAGGKAANDRRKALLAVFKWAIPRGYAETNPVEKTERKASNSEGHEFFK